MQPGALLLQEGTVENLFFFFFPTTGYSKISALGTAIDWGHLLQPCKFQCEAVFVWATHGVCATSVHSWDWLAAGAVCGSVATRAVPQDKTAAKALAAG